MITREEVEQLLDVNKKEKIKEDIIKYIDDVLKSKLEKGETHIVISTGMVDRSKDFACKSPFFELWKTKELHPEALKTLKKEVIELYEKVGFEVYETWVDHGWNSSYRAIVFDWKVNK